MGGGVRCRRSASRRFAELVDGDVVGGLIAPTARWHLGHFDGEGAAMTSPEHVACNTGAPSGLRGATVTGYKPALCWGSEPPARSIGWERPLGPTDSGLSVLFDDPPDPDDLADPVDGLPPGITLVCLDCLVDASGARPWA